MATVNEKMTAIADAIRDKTGGTDALTLDGMATEIPKVYEAGKQVQNDEFWDKYQAGMYVNETTGEVEGNASRAFAGAAWNAKTFYPKHNIHPITAVGLFYYFNEGYSPMDLIARLKECNITLDTSKVSNLAQLFFSAAVSTVPTISTVAITGLIDRLFSGASNLKVIEKLVLRENGTQTFNQVFQNNRSLEEIRIEGTIGGSGFDIHYSTKLSRESLLSILQACKKDNAGVTITLPLKCIDGATNTESYISGDTELSTALSSATAKGYTVNFD
ncbi:MAG: hypothetical protein IJ285_06850 [Clostridia bacterium]|nr:hypothetical protein [Clostridia bacterium]